MINVLLKIKIPIEFHYFKRSFLNYPPSLYARLMVKKKLIPFPSLMIAKLFSTKLFKLDQYTIFKLPTLMFLSLCEYSLITYKI